ncbi:MAG: hypothetical protein KCHDKBKB_02022 [Elusimicrobia bacterium]|nr:hypothetical protein [Elusimicrobiota bacterium]
MPRHNQSLPGCDGENLSCLLLNDHVAEGFGAGRIVRGRISAESHGARSRAETSACFNEIGRIRGTDFPDDQSSIHIHHASSLIVVAPAHGEGGGDRNIDGSEIARLNVYAARFCGEVHLAIF